MFQDITFQDITLLIAGPLNKNSVDYIDIYKKLNIDIIYSTYKPQNKEEIELLNKLENILSSDKISCVDLPDTTNVINTRNVYLQCYSCFNGVKLCTTKFIIKTRSDWYFDNLKLLIEFMILNSSYVITCNLGSARTTSTNYHPPDFIIGMETKIMMCVMYDLINNVLLDINIYPSYFVPEIYICLSTVNYYGHKITRENYQDKIKCSKIMKDLYRVINVWSLQPTIWTSVFKGVKTPDEAIENYFCKSHDDF